MSSQPSASTRLAVRDTAGVLAREVAARVGDPPGLVPLLLRAVPPWPDCDPPSSFGFYVSADGRDPGRVRVVVQPATDCEPEELRSLLAPFGEAGAEAADLLDALGLEAGFFRGGWETAIGIDGPHLRVYAGAVGPGGIDVAPLERAGWWPPPLGPRAEEALAGMLGALVGCARRLSGPTAWGLYLLAVAPLAEVELPERPAALSEFLALCGGEDEFLPGRYGWQLGLDSDGELVDWKLDFRDPPHALADALAADHALSPFIAWCASAAAAAGAGFEVSSASLRFSPVGETITAYVQFLCPSSGASAAG
jgi:hypothetical protein